MVDASGAVVGRARDAERIVLDIERPVHRAAEHQAARQAHRAERIEAVRVLHHPRLERARRQAGAEAVRLDRVRDLRPPRRVAAPQRQPLLRLHGREPRRQRAPRRVLRHRHAVVQPRRRQHDVQPRPLGGRELPRVPHDAPHVLEPVRHVAPLRRQGRDAALLEISGVQRHAPRESPARAVHNPETMPPHGSGALQSALTTKNTQ